MAEGEGRALLVVPEGEEAPGLRPTAQDAEARMLMKALTAGNGSKAYHIIKMWVADMIEELDQDSGQGMGPGPMGPME